MTERKRFEVWAKSIYLDVGVHKEGNERFVDWNTQTAWSAWQAATAQAEPKIYECGCSASPATAPDYCPVHDISHTGRMQLPVEPSHGGISVAPTRPATRRT